MNKNHNRKTGYTISSLRSLSPMELAQLAKMILASKGEPMTSMEIIEELISQKFGSHWMIATEKNAYIHAKRVAEALSQILSRKSHGEEVRAKLGIGLLRKKNTGRLAKPLKFYLIEYSDFAFEQEGELKPPEKPTRKNPYYG
jgi:hypothetical protein